MTWSLIAPSVTWFMITMISSTPKFPRVPIPRKWVWVGSVPQPETGEEPEWVWGSELTESRRDSLHFPGFMCSIKDTIKPFVLPSILSYVNQTRDNTVCIIDRDMFSMISFWPIPYTRLPRVMCSLWFIIMLYSADSGSEIRNREDQTSW